MAHPSKRPHPASELAPPGSFVARMAEQSQTDFELDFFAAVLERRPDFFEVLRAQGSNLATKGRHGEGLQIAKRLVQVRPHDPLAHYNLACCHALLKQPDDAFDWLRKAVELGYRDFRYMREDRDLEAIRKDPRFRRLIREFENG